MPIGIAKLQSTCPKCKAAINAGQVITWGKGTKSSHVNCNTPDIAVESIQPNVQHSQPSTQPKERLTEIVTGTTIEELERLLEQARETKAREDEKRRREQLRLAGVSESCIELGFDASDPKDVLTHVVNCSTCQPTVEESPDVITNSGDSDSTSIDLSHLDQYVAQNGELDKIEKAIRAGLNIGIKGPAGCGKTLLVHCVAQKLNAELFEIVGDGGVMREDIIGSRGYNGTETYWIDGTATRALRRSRDAFVILYIDEPNRLREELQGALFSIMDHRKRLVLPENSGEVIQSRASRNCSRGLIVISSWNDNYRGTTQLDEAFNDRYDVGLTLSYLPKDRETHLLHDRTGIDISTAETIVNVADQLRQSADQKVIQTPISTRSLLAWSYLVTAGFNVRDAGELALVEKVSGTYELERKVIRDVLHANTDGQVTA